MTKLLLILLLVVGCESNEGKIIGNWKMDYRNAEYLFEKGGDLIITNHNDDMVIPCTYSITDDFLTMKLLPANLVRVFKIEWVNYNELKLHLQDGEGGYIILDRDND